MQNFMQERNSFKIDIHAHWLPNVDDGARSLGEGLQMIQGLQDLGFESLVATPHIMLGFYDNQPDELRSAFDAFKRVCLNRGMNIQLDLAAEYMLDEGFEYHLEKGDLLTIHNQYIMIEMSLIRPYPALRQIIIELTNKGYQPILAHPERYLYYRKNIRELLELKEIGCFFQINGLSYSGYYGKRISKLCRQMLRKDLFDFWGSDIHRPDQIQKLTLDYGRKRFKNNTAFNGLQV